MNSAELYTKEGKPTGVFYCTKCSKIPNGHKPTKENAEACCAPRICDCGAEIKSGYQSTCEKCQREAFRARFAKQYADRLERAKEVESMSPDCMLFDPCSDEYFDEIESYLEDCEENEIEPKEFPFIAPFQPVVMRDAADLLESSTDDHCEEIWDNAPDFTEINAAIEKANAMFAEKKWGSYFPDYALKIRVQKEGGAE